MSDLRKIANDLIRKELSPRLKEIRAPQSHSPVTPGQVAIAAAALKRGVWKEKDVKKHFDRMFDKVPDR